MSSNDHDERQIRELERERGNALIARSASALDALFTDDLVHIHTTGQQMDKAQLMRHVMEVLHFLSVEREDLRVQCYGDIAVMTGRMRTRMQPVGRPDTIANDARVTQVWRRTPQGWRQSHFQATRIAEAPAGAGASAAKSG